MRKTFFRFSASLTKGFTSLAVNSLVLAQKSGVLEALTEELQSSQPSLFKQVLLSEYFRTV